MELQFFEFTLKETFPFDPEREAVSHDIKIQIPISPDTYGQVLKHISSNDIVEAGKLIIEQYMWTAAGKDEKATELHKHILSDGRLIVSCFEAFSPMLEICDTEIKKN